jgi:type II secretory pathway component PulM
VRLKRFPQLITDNQLLIWLSRIPPRYRWGVTLCIIFSFLVLWSFLFVVPLFLDVRVNKKKVESCKAQTVQLKRFISTQKKSLSEVIKKIKSKKFCSSVKLVAKNTYEVRLRGEFAYVLKFLNELKEEKMLKIEKFVCNKGKGGKVEAILNVCL